MQKSIEFQMPNDEISQLSSCYITHEVGKRNTSFIEMLKSNFSQKEISQLYSTKLRHTYGHAPLAVFIEN